MSNLRSKMVDKQRYSKVYSFVRPRPVYEFRGDNDLAIEVGSITFSNADSGTLTYEFPFFDTSYSIVAMPRDTSGNANVLIYVESFTTTNAVIRSSAPFTGIVDIIAIKVG